MTYSIIVKKLVKKNLWKMPLNVRQKFEALMIALRDGGPTGPYKWSNYSKLGENEYHCHLQYSYVACWRHEKETIIIEVYYAGNRENAPY